MSGPIKTKIILSENVRDGEKIFKEKIKDYPYLNDPGMEDKRVQLDLLIRQGASDAFIETLFGDPEEMNADEIDIVRAFVRIAGERFFYDYLHHQSVSMKEAREFLRMHLFWMEALSGEDAEDGSISDWEGVGGFVAFSSPAVIRGMKAELRREINEGMEKLAQQYARNTACAFSASGREEDLKKIIDILSKEVKEKDKWIKYMEEQRRDLRASCEKLEEPASGPEPKTGEKQCRDHQDGIGNARAPDNSSSTGPDDAGKEKSLPEEGGRRFLFMGKRTGRRDKKHLSPNTTAVLEEYRKARHSDE